MPTYARVEPSIGGSSGPRYALYFTPAPGSALAVFGAEVLGYDSDAGRDVAPVLDGLDAVTTEAGTYGFHATLKPPMRLAAGIGERDLLVAVEALVRHRPDVAVGPLAVAEVGAFLALVPVAPPPELGLLAAECVAALDPLRAPLTEEERGRRQPERLDARGRALLDRWGYPYVFEAFRFHMTLTDALREPERQRWRERLARLYGDGEPLVIDALTVLRQDGSRPFRVLERFRFSGERDAA